MNAFNTSNCSGLLINSPSTFLSNFGALRKNLAKLSGLEVEGGGTFEEAALGGFRVEDGGGVEGRRGRVVGLGRRKGQWREGKERRRETYLAETTRHMLH
jgi:hypothetical protein